MSDWIFDPAHHAALVAAQQARIERLLDAERVAEDAPEPEPPTFTLDGRLEDR